jgi:DNA-binding NarL/FixJ family response regulator
MTNPRYVNPIHILPTDIVMPEVNGYELAGQLRARRPELKVLHMTGCMDGAGREFRARTGQRHIAKYSHSPARETRDVV